MDRSSATVRSLIFLGSELRLRVHEQEDRATQQQRAQRDQHLPGLEPTREAALISFPQPVELSVEEVREPAFVLLGAKDLGAHHWRQGERDDAGYGDGAGQRERELRKQSSGQTSLETDRNICGDEHDGHRNDRSAELARRLYGGRERGHALFR